ncbi:MAG: THUMP domain-containing protein [Porphyromonas sp.]|nr:THUMP domain-containing protein [Porphyromonas sp.]
MTSVQMLPTEKGEEFEMLAKTMYGLEDILQKELEELGAKEIIPGRRMVAFKGDLELLYKANIHLRTALRILVPIAQFEAKNADEIYQYLYDNIAWTKYLNSRSTFAFDTVVYSEDFTHSKFVAYRAKDAVSDYFTDHGDKRPNVSVSDPDVLFHIHISENTVTLALDSSGESLHKRGYRVSQNEAPISEVLAAGILLRSGWSGESAFLDPMCGSGTFLIEAALIALHIPPGIYRSQYAFERWYNFDADLLSEVLEDWDEVPCEHKIYGSDSNPKSIAIARANIKTAGLQNYIDLSVKAIEEYSRENRPAESGMIMMNPPYGDRMKPDDLEQLYSNIGSTLKHGFPGWKAWIITGSITEGFDAIGLKHFHREKLFNGALETELRAFDLFEGKRDLHLHELEESGELEEIRSRRMAVRRSRDDFRESRQSYRFGKASNDRPVPRRRREPSETSSRDDRRAWQDAFRDRKKNN